MIIDKLSKLADDVRIRGRHLVNERSMVLGGFEEGVAGTCWDQVIFEVSVEVGFGGPFHLRVC